MLTLEKILTEEFQNSNINEKVAVLAQHNLYEIVANAIQLLNHHFGNKQYQIKTFNTIQTHSVAVVMLTTTNQYFRQLKAENRIDEYRELEYLMGNIAKRMLIYTLKETPVKKQQAQLESIFHALHDTCTLLKFDFEALSSFIRIDEIFQQQYFIQNKKAELVKFSSEEKLHALACFGLKHEKIKHFASIFQHFNICTETEKIEQLFQSPTTNLNIQFNEANPVFVIQFLAVLKISRLIKHKHCGGLYQVFMCHVKNFEQVFLEGNTPQRCIYKAKQRTDYEINKEKFDALFKTLK